ncbi:MAG: hypothetical protein EOO91_05465 [Pedobacter sp.]|nr:MAG: hypothetical protein EOO91_05465 [Pedobacter sp.]
MKSNLAVLGQKSVPPFASIPDEKIGRFSRLSGFRIKGCGLRQGARHIAWQHKLLLIKRVPIAIGRSGNTFCYAELVEAQKDCSKKPD